MTSRKSASSSPHAATLSFEYADAESAERVARAVGPEEDDIDGDRTTAAIERDGATLAVTIGSADLVALRAGLNTWSSLISVAEDAGDVALA